MEILSTGEKIKRARIYKGITLKELCNDKISISKMSCIENGKVKAEEWILEEVSKKLSLDFEYLKQDVKEQIDMNIQRIKKENDSSRREKEILYSLDYAVEYGLYDRAFNLMHLLFSVYLYEENYDSIQLNISQYHNFLQKSWSEENQLIYDYDTAKYFYATKEFSEALVYYQKILDTLESSQLGSKHYTSEILYNLADVYYKLEDYEEALKVTNKYSSFIENISSKKLKGMAYSLTAILTLPKDRALFKTLENKTLKAFEEDLEGKASFYLSVGKVLLESNDIEEGKMYIKNGLKAIAEGADERVAEYILGPLERLLDLKDYSYGEELCEILLEKAIKADDIKLIEKSYFYKSLISKAQGNFSQAEMYMNLSLDALLKFAGNQERYERYLAMGNMYYDMGEYNDSIKYFSLALGEEKKL